MRTNTLTNILRFDAATNSLAGIALLGVGGLLAKPMGLVTSWPIRIVGLALVYYGLENLMISRNIIRGGLMAVAAVDLVFAVAVVILAITNPTSAASWVRWSLVAIADLSAAFGIAKIIGLRSCARTAPPGRATWSLAAELALRRSLLNNQTSSQPRGTSRSRRR